MMYLAIRVLLVLVISSPCLGQTRQTITLYSEPDCGERGNQETFRGACEDLSICGGKMPDNVAKSVRSTGAWTVYYDSDFDDALSMPTSIFGLQMCQNLALAGESTSLRFAGSPILEEDTITLYEKSYFRGEEYYFTEPRVADFTADVQSVVITGPLSWSLYTLPNFDGASFCVNPTMVNFIGFSFDLENEFGINRIRSFERGCE